jgi:hypothetical protein
MGSLELEPGVDDRVAIRNDRLETAAIRARDVNDNSCSHK